MSVSADDVAAHGWSVAGAGICREPGTSMATLTSQRRIGTSTGGKSAENITMRFMLLALGPLTHDFTENSTSNNRKRDRPNGSQDENGPKANIMGTPVP